MWEALAFWRMYTNKHPTTWVCENFYLFRCSEYICVDGDDTVPQEALSLYVSRILIHTITPASDVKSVTIDHSPSKRILHTVGRPYFETLHMHYDSHAFLEYSRGKNLTKPLKLLPCLPLTNNYLRPSSSDPWCVDPPMLRDSVAKGARFYLVRARNNALKIQPRP